MIEHFISLVKSPRPPFVLLTLNEDDIATGSWLIRDTNYQLVEDLERIIDEHNRRRDEGENPRPKAVTK